MTMTPKEELIQAIERSPDDLILALLELLKVMKQRSSEAMRSETLHTIQQQNKPESSSVYPLRGLPLVIAEDFDEPMPEIWEALSE